MSFSLSADDTKRIWPRKQPLSSFINSGACTKNTELIVSEYFDELKPVVRKVRENLHRISLSAKTTLERLSKNMEEYNISNTITNALVRYDSFDFITI